MSVISGDSFVIYYDLTKRKYSYTTANEMDFTNSNVIAMAYEQEDAEKITGFYNDDMVNNG